MKKLLRSLLALFGSLILISILVETVEFLLVTALHGSITSDQQVYFGIRNRPWVLALKLLYTFGGGLVGGYVAAWLAGRAELKHALILAGVQAVAMIWGMTASEYADTMPRWAWILVTLDVALAIVVGGWLRSRKMSEARRAKG